MQGRLQLQSFDKISLPWDVTTKEKLSVLLVRRLQCVSLTSAGFKDILLIHYHCFDVTSFDAISHPE